MTTEKRYGSAKRFGSRYGKYIRDKIALVEQERKKKHTCPYCKYVGGVRRIATGIWYCKKCDAKFTAKAYTIEKKRTVIAAEEPVQEPVESEEEQTEEELEEEGESDGRV